MQTLTYTIGKDRRALVKDIQNFTIDFNDQGVKNWVQARQYERSMRQVFVNVNNDDDNPFNLTGCNVWFEGVLPDKTHKILDAKHAVILDAQNGQFRFDMPAQAFAVAGSYVQAFFRIVRDGQSITTLEFDLEVLADKVISGLIPSDYITPFEDLYDQLEQIVNNADGKLQDKLTEWNQKLQNLFDTLNKMGTDTQTLLQTLQNRIAELEAKIKQDGLFTQAEADAFKQEVIIEIKQQQDDFMSRLNEQLNTSSQEALYASQTDWIAELPDYMASSWAGVVNNVPHGDHIFNFALLSDNHFQLDNAYSYRSLDHYVWFGEAARRAGVDAVVVNGDNINGDNYSLTYAEANKKQLVQSTLTVVDVLEGSINASTPCFWIKGNHDTGVMNEIGITGPQSTLSEQDLKHYYHTTDCRYGEVRNGDSLYFYKDFHNQKIRLIGLNTIDDTDELNSDGSWKTKGINSHKIRQEQLEWLANTALKVPDANYQVIFCFHTPLNNTIGSEAELQNSDALLNIIKAYKNGSSTTINTSGDYPISSLNVDFTSQGRRTVVGIFNGHLHYDANNTTALNGTPIIEQTCSTIQAHGGVRAKDTVNEDAWDIVSIDTAKRQIHMYRFGAGDDQSFNY